MFECTLLKKSVVFLHRDERWRNLRKYLLDRYGVTRTTLFYGIVIWLICPVLFRLQYILLGMVQSNKHSQKCVKTCSNLGRFMADPIVFIYDFSIFKQNPSDVPGLSLLEVVRLICGYIIYLMPIGLLLTAFSLIRFNIPLCRKLHAPWLLDNTATPAPFILENGKSENISFPDLKTARETYGAGKDVSAGGMVWKDIQLNPTSKEKVMNLDGIPDLLRQYNFVGYHDICIYPTDMHGRQRDMRCEGKKLAYCYPGYTRTNSSGEDFNHQTYTRKLLGG